MSCRQVFSGEYYEILATELEMPDFVKNAIDHNENTQEDADVCREIIDENVSIFYIKKELFTENRIRELGYRHIPKIFGVQADFQQTLYQAGISQVKNPPLELSGLDTLVGIIDTGFYFGRGLQAESRIVKFWNQVEDPELTWSEDSRREGSTDSSGHGSAIVSTIYNIAPLAEICLVKCRQASSLLKEYYCVEASQDAYSEVDILRAVKYLYEYAQSVNKPLVICIGFGTNQGDHSGSGYLQEYLKRIGQKKNTVVLVCNGNEADKLHHTSVISFQNMESQDIEFRVDERCKQCYLECWSEVTSRAVISLQTPGGERVENIDTRTGTQMEVSFLFSSTKVDIRAILVEQGSGRSLITFRFRELSAGIWTITLKFRYPSQNIKFQNVQLWLPIESFILGKCNFLSPSPILTLTEPATGNGVISIGTYSDENGSIAAFSGRGPNSKLLLKPDLCGPGVNIQTDVGIFTGSSIACAVTVGAVALFLEWCVTRGNNRVVTTESIKKYLILGANRSEDLQYPNIIWGYGKLNLNGIFEALAGIN